MNGEELRVRDMEEQLEKAATGKPRWLSEVCLAAFVLQTTSFAGRHRYSLVQKSSTFFSCFSCRTPLTSPRLD